MDMMSSTMSVSVSDVMHKLIDFKTYSCMHSLFIHSFVGILILLFDSLTHRVSQSIQFISSLKLEFTYFIDYWTIQNSWGRFWGEEGFIRILKTSSIPNNSGICGFDSIPILPLGASIINDYNNSDQPHHLPTYNDENSIRIKLQELFDIFIDWLQNNWRVSFISILFMFIYFLSFSLIFIHFIV